MEKTWLRRPALKVSFQTDMFACKPPTAHCLLNVVSGVRVSIYFEPQMIFHVWKTAANYFTSQGKQNHVNSQVLSRIKNVYFPHDR